MTITEEIIKKVNKNKIPYTVMFEITYNCNLNCIHCYIMKQEKEELRTEEIKKIIDEIRDSGCLFVVLTGGEPFMRTDFFELCEYIRKKKLALEIITNGTLITKDVAKFLKKINVFKVAVSLYGTRKEIHEKITRIENSFEMTINAIMFLKKEGILTSIKCPLMKENIEEYYSMKELGKKLGIKVNFDPMLWPKSDGNKEPISHIISDEELEKFIKENLEIKNNGVRSNFFCDAGHSLCGITPYGDVYPCLQFPLNLGNLRNTSFKGIWNSEKLNNYRKLKFENICSNCGYKNYCPWCPAISYILYKKFCKFDIACKIARIRKNALTYG